MDFGTVDKLMKQVKICERKSIKNNKEKKKPGQQDTINSRILEHQPTEPQKPIIINNLAITE